MHMLGDTARESDISNNLASLDLDMRYYDGSLQVQVFPICWPEVLEGLEASPNPKCPTKFLASPMYMM